ncbi:hypothetical protein A0H81_10309 [Grifola frondosa]|uniref:Transmembrane protein n=1 Tax=Grifola frondosa TaxID=5627 RepID=A0A1C7LY47_GRIFR|nr:hypothetical protein A0H81_10309 [Grifola frondosa]
MNYFRERFAHLFLSLRSSLPTTASAQSIELASTAITTVIEPPIPTINARFRWIGRRGCLGRRPNQGWDDKQHVEHATARSHDNHNVSLLSKALRFVNSLFSTLYSYIFLLQLSTTHRWRIVRLIDAREKPGSEERWESFKARMTLEWQVIVTACGVFLAVAISLMQIPDIMANPLTNALNWVTVFCTCAGLFIGLAYLVHFSSLETTKADASGCATPNGSSRLNGAACPCCSAFPPPAYYGGLLSSLPAPSPISGTVILPETPLFHHSQHAFSDEKNEEDGEGDADREPAVDADRI